MGRGKVAGVVRAGIIWLSIAAALCGAETAAYVGSRACAGCHTKIYQEYVRTAMGRSMAVAAEIPAAATASVFSEKVNRHFEVSRRGQDFYQSEYEVDSDGREVFRATHKLEYAIGSGVNGYTFLVRRGNYLFQAPLSYYARKKSWDLSPGYEFADYGFNRPIAAACIGCHSGRPQVVRGREGLFGDPAFQELAIGCENCHGPGGVHVGERGRQVGDLPHIVNPAKLTARLAEDICMNCHQGSDTRVLRPGKDYFDFRPGAALRDTLAILRVPLARDAAGQSDLLEHHFSMQLSQCYRGSGGHLSCLTCHQIHAMPRAAEAAAYYRGRCLTCHAESSCKLPRAKRLEDADDCAGCHMPKRDVEVIAHSALTNHRIIARPGEPLPETAFDKGTADLPDLVYVNRATDGERAALPPVMLLQAYGELMEKNPEYQPRYLAVLDALSKNAPASALVEAAQGRMMLRGDPASNPSAIEHLARAIDLGFSAYTVYEDLAEAQARGGRNEDAIQTLERGVEVNPYTAVLYKALALRYITAKRYAEAKKTLARYVELFPEDDFVRGLVRKVENTDAAHGR